ncbi:MAG: cupin domain-containing protein [Nanoarchaeota archaeon]|nr:cupin domain-containing protein [Nanoarchaeota archaeon]
MEINEVKEVKKIWGKEIWMANTDKYCGKLLKIEKGKRCSIHYHKIKDETFYILEGRVLMEVDNKIAIMEKGEVVRIVPLTKHRFSGLKDSIIIEISTHHDDSDSCREEGEPSGEVPEGIMKKYGE